MAKLRLDIYGGYSGEKKPDPDHIYSWRQDEYENTEQYKARILQYVIDLIDELDEGEPEDDSDND